MYTLQDIKDAYYAELTLGIETRGFDDYLKDNYVPVYDINCNFLGYSRDSSM